MYVTGAKRKIIKIWLIKIYISLNKVTMFMEKNYKNILIIYKKYIYIIYGLYFLAPPVDALSCLGSYWCYFQCDCQKCKIENRKGS